MKSSKQPLPVREKEEEKKKLSEIKRCPQAGAFPWLTVRLVVINSLKRIGGII